ALAAIASAALLVCGAKGVQAQESPAPVAPAVPPSEPSKPAVQLPDEIQDVLKLPPAKVHDDVTVAFIEGSGRKRKLTAAQLLELRKEGVSDRVLVAMLSAPSSSAAAASPPQPAASFFSAMQPTTASAPAQPVYAAADAAPSYSYAS